jgi:polyisoprenoid-binding protein YceI
MQFNKTKWLGIIATMAACAAAPLAGSTEATRIEPIEWSIDASRSDARFTVTKLGYENVTGVFRESEGEIRCDPDRPQDSSVKWRVRVASPIVRMKWVFR